MSQFREVLQGQPDDEPASTFTKASVGLSNVDNTADASKPVSAAQAAADAAVAAQAAANLAVHTSNLSNPHNTTKAQVGLSLVDNTPDSAKPVSTAQAAADAAVAAAASSALTSGLATKQKKVTISDTAPSSPEAGDEWIEASTGIKWTWIVDVDSSQWVEMGGSPQQATDPEILAGTETDVRSVSPANLKLAAETHGGAPTIASQAEAEAGSNNTKTMTSLRVAQALTAQLGTKSIDGTFATNSDAKIPTEKAIKTYVDAAIAALFTTPTLTSAAINAAGTSLTLGFSKPVTIGAGGNGGWLLNPTGADVTLTYASGSGTSSLVYTISRAILQTSEETAVVSYTQPGNGVEDLLGVDLATISTPVAVTNGSTQTGVTTPTLVSAAIVTVSGAEYLDIEFSEAVAIGAGSHGLTLNASGGALTATYSSGAGTDTLRFSLSRRVEDDETVTLDHTQAGNGIESDDDDTDVASFSDAAVTNSSSYTGASGASYSDNFDGAGQFPLTSPWESGPGDWTDMYRNSNTLLGSGGDAAARLGTSAATFAANQWAEMKPGSSYLEGSGPAVRMDTNGNCYYLVGENNAGDHCLKVVKATANGATKTQLGAVFNLGAYPQFAGTAVLRLQATGTTTTTLEVFLDGVSKGTRDDSSSPHTSGQPGIIHLGGGAGGDDFAAADV